jgi:hypothetical protein
MIELVPVASASELAVCQLARGLCIVHNYCLFILVRSVYTKDAFIWDIHPMDTIMLAGVHFSGIDC